MLGNGRPRDQETVVNDDRAREYMVSSMLLSVVNRKI